MKSNSSAEESEQSLSNLSFKAFLDLLRKRGKEKDADVLKGRVFKKLGKYLSQDDIYGLRFNEVLLSLNLTKFVSSGIPQKNSYTKRMTHLEALGYTVFANKKYFDRR